jgi:hypothetical protein
MNKDEALKLALEALESCGAGHITDGGNQWYDEKLVDKAITAIKQARSAPYVQSAERGEPVAVYGYCPICGAEGVMRERRPNGYDKCAKGHTYPSSKATPPAAKRPVAEPHKWVGLTDEELSGIYNQTDWNVNEDWNYERAIEAKLKEKNNG